MIVFVGSADRGYFAEEIAEKKEMPFACVETKSRIVQQTPKILGYKGVEYMIFDINQYLDSPEELAEEILRISNCNNAKIIAYAPGFMLKHKVLVELYKRGVRNYILGTTLAEMKQQLELCLSCYYEVNGVEELETITLKEQEEEERIAGSYKLVGFCGSMQRIGTTTQSMQVIKYLMLKGYKACYVEMNDSGYVESLYSHYNVEEHDEELGDVLFMKVHHFYRQDKISEILKLGYDYYIYDYGVYSHQNFNKTSFLEKDIRIACVGSKASEMLYTKKLICSNFYSDIYYLFIHTPDSDKKDLQESMEDKKENTYFPGYSPEPYELAVENVKILEKIIPVTEQTEQSEKKNLLRGWFKRKNK